MPTMQTLTLEPGTRIRVHQEIDRREGNWTHDVEGEVVWVRSEPTGSWHAHGKNDKLWLYRIRLRKPNGELTTLVVDQHTRIDVLNGGASDAREAKSANP